jgi:hypothetical protein
MSIYTKWFTTGLLCVCLPNCNSENGELQVKSTRVVHVPRRVWPGCKAAPEMDALFRELRPGQEVKVHLVFEDQQSILVTPEAFQVKRGSVYFYSKAGYFRLDSNGRVLSSPDGTQEVDVMSAVTTVQGVTVASQEIQIRQDAIWNTKSTKLGLDARFLGQPLESLRENGKYVAAIVVKMSEDFEGQIGGWRWIKKNKIHA